MAHLPKHPVLANLESAASASLLTVGASPRRSPMPSPVLASSLTSEGMLESDSSASPPIPLGSNYHSGAADGRVAATSLPRHHIQQDSLSFLSPGPMPILPRRFNDDSTHGHLGPHSASPGLRGQAPQRSVSTPHTPLMGPDAGHTGNAPAVEAAAAAMMQQIMLNPAQKPCHHNHKARFDHTHDEESAETAERDAQDAPESRQLYEKDENGVFQFAAHPLSVDTPGGMVRNRSQLGLSMSSPAGGGAGPRAPPVALVSSTLAASTLHRQSSADGSFHPHGTAKLPYNRVQIDYAPSAPSAELREIATHVRTCLELRAKFVWTPLRSEQQYDIFNAPEYVAPSLDAPLPAANSTLHWEFVDGVVVSWSGDADRSAPGNKVFEVPNRAEFSAAMSSVMDLAISGPAKTFCHNRLHVLEARFNLHELLNHDIEQLVQKSVPHRDFYNVRKIDNHVHHSAAMNQKHLLRFIKAKLKKNSSDIVIVRDGKALTLPEVFKTLNMTAYDLNVDTLDMHADKTFHRFDKFNLKYNPVGESRLREIFLKYNNYIKGKYLAEVTQQVFEDLESNKYQFAEYRLSIYGAKRDEWNALSEWVVDHKLFSSNMRWMIQVPRLYSIYKASGQIKNFAEMLRNIFTPLFDVTLDPSCNPKLHVFLESCVGFDMVDDESLRERPYNESLPCPDEWDYEYDPPYAHFAYYLYANLCALNKLRSFRGLNTFAFRPHCGEAGDMEHLAAGFLLAKGINHGLNLQKSPALQYLYYLAQIGISMSPLSNNLLFLEYDKNPFPRFFKKGLNVTLSTDDPLMIHVTREPLVEEYSVAAQVWKLSAIDMSEIARNSVLQSGFEQQFKAHFIGNNYWKRSLEGNDIRQTNLPDIRIQFRSELLGDEFRSLHHHTKLTFDESLIDRIM